MRLPKIVTVAKKSLDEHKAEDIEVIDVKDITPFADYYLIATAPNLRALGAIADYVIDDLEKAKFTVNKKEGLSDSGWVIVDAGEVVIHLFSEEKRHEIDLDALVEHSKSKLSK